MSRYLLDANVFIQAKNMHYGLDFCPAFWDWLVTQNDEGKVLSIEKVKDELRAGEDELTAWASGRSVDFFVPPDDSIFPALQRVSQWANTNGYEPSAIATFLGRADYWIVSHALAHQLVVVTHEVAADTVRKIKIPNACQGLGLRCITPYVMLRHEHARFVLGGN